MQYGEGGTVNDIEVIFSAVGVFILVMVVPFSSPTASMEDNSCMGVRISPFHLVFCTLRSVSLLNSTIFGLRCVECC